MLWFAGLTAPALGAEECRKWRVKRDGRTMTLEGRVSAGVRNGCVQLRLATGVNIGVYQVAEFSEADIAYMREATQRLQAEVLQKQQAQAATAAPRQRAGGGRRHRKKPARRR